MGATKHISLHQGASAEQRLMEAIRRHFRAYGGSPSTRDLLVATGIALTDIRRLLRKLAAKGMIVLHIGRARGIELPDPTMMLSDSQLDLVAAARGANVSWPVVSVLPLAVAYQPQDGADSTLPVHDLIAQIDAVTEETTYDASADRGRGWEVGDLANGGTAHA